MVSLLHIMKDGLKKNSGGRAIKKRISVFDFSGKSFVMFHCGEFFV